MSRNGIIALVIVIILVIIGVWYYTAHKSPSANQSAGEAATATSTQGDYSTTLPTGSDTSDAAISTDLTAIDSQMGGFASDSASMSDGVSAQETGGSPE